MNPWPWNKCKIAQITILCSWPFFIRVVGSVSKLDKRFKFSCANNSVKKKIQIDTRTKGDMYYDTYLQNVALLFSLHLILNYPKIPQNQPIRWPQFLLCFWILIQEFKPSMKSLQCMYILSAIVIVAQPSPIQKSRIYLSYFVPAHWDYFLKKAIHFFDFGLQWIEIVSTFRIFPTTDSIEFIYSAGFFLKTKLTVTEYPT